VFKDVIIVVVSLLSLILQDIRDSEADFLSFPV